MDGNEIDAQPAGASADEDEDCYFEGNNMVFTAAFHLKRGFCCGSRCRHCPYDYANVASDPKATADHGAEAPADGAAPPTEG